MMNKCERPAGGGQVVESCPLCEQSMLTLLLANLRTQTVHQEKWATLREGAWPFLVPRMLLSESLKGGSGIPVIILLLVGARH